MLPLRRSEPVAIAGDALRDRVVLITGATGGLGRACAIACASASAATVPYSSVTLPGFSVSTT